MSEETVAERLARIETKLDLALTTKADHERRLRAVERWMWGAVGLGGAGALSGLWSLVGG